MPRGKPVMAYADQEELIARILALAPQTSLSTMALLIQENYGTSLTSSNFRRARERNDALPPAAAMPKGAKLAYIQNLFIVRPTLGADQVRAKTRLFFGEDTRGDIIEEARMRARTLTTTPAQAQELITQAESRVAHAPVFDLQEDAHGDQDLSAPDA